MRETLYSVLSEEPQEYNIKMQKIKEIKHSSERLRMAENEKKVAKTPPFCLNMRVI